MDHSGMAKPAWPIGAEDATDLRKAWAKEGELRGRLAILVMEQHRLCQEAEAAMRAREDICLRIQTKYRIPPDVRWTLDGEENAIHVEDK